MFRGMELLHMLAFFGLARLANSIIPGKKATDAR
jgi:hypothetical protein